MVETGKLDDPEEIALVRRMIERHAQYTQSRRARLVLDAWTDFLPRFVRVIPNDFRRVLDAQRKMRQSGLTPEQAEMAAFQQNAQDAMRAGGN
jgi:glutamate synthase (ferredoxin)